MKNFRVIVSEIQTYEVFIGAMTAEEAEEIALDCYGVDGELTSTDTEVIDIEEEN